MAVPLFDLSSPTHGWWWWWWGWENVWLHLHAHRSLIDSSAVWLHLTRKRLWHWWPLLDKLGPCVGIQHYTAHSVLSLPQAIWQGMIHMTQLGIIRNTVSHKLSSSIVEKLYSCHQNPTIPLLIFTSHVLCTDISYTHLVVLINVVMTAQSKDEWVQTRSG